MTLKSVGSLRKFLSENISCEVLDSVLYATLMFFAIHVTV